MYNPPALAKFAIEQQQLLLSQEIFEKRWIHSREEDTNDSQTYRPSTFNFPLSRGRIAFEIEKNGTFIQYGIGPDDTRKKVEGNWTIEEEEPNTIKIDFAIDKAPCNNIITTTIFQQTRYLYLKVNWSV
jgi:hypothetical protein